MCIQMHTNVRACMHACMHTVDCICSVFDDYASYIYIYMYIYIYIHTYRTYIQGRVSAAFLRRMLTIRSYIYTTHMHKYIHTCPYTKTYVYTHNGWCLRNMLTYIHICINTYIYTHNIQAHYTHIQVMVSAACLRSTQVLVVLDVSRTVVALKTPPRYTSVCKSFLTW